MKKSNILMYIILGVSMIVFSVLVFTIPSNSGGVFWWGYIFTMIAFLGQIPFTYLAYKNANSLKKAFLGIPTTAVGLVYLIAQVIWGLICIFVPFISVTSAVVVSVVLLGVFIIALCIMMFAKSIVGDIDDKIKTKTFFIKSLLVDVEVLAVKANDIKIKEIINRLIETVKYSDPMSAEALQSVEGRISDKFNELQLAVESNNVENVEKHYEAINILFVERNKKCKLLK